MNIVKKIRLIGLVAGFVLLLPMTGVSADSPSVSGISRELICQCGAPRKKGKAHVD